MSRRETEKTLRKLERLPDFGEASATYKKAVPSDQRLAMYHAEAIGSSEPWKDSKNDSLKHLHLSAPDTGPRLQRNWAEERCDLVGTHTQGSPHQAAPGQIRQDAARKKTDHLIAHGSVSHGASFKN